MNLVNMGTESTGKAGFLNLKYLRGKLQVGSATLVLLSPLVRIRESAASTLMVQQAKQPLPSPQRIASQTQGCQLGLEGGLQAIEWADSIAFG